MVQIPAFFRLPIRLNHGPPVQQAVVISGGQAHPARRGARTMKQHPLITYSSLIRGGLHLIPGGFAPPARKRMHAKDLPPEPPSPRSTLATSPADAVWARLRKIYAALFSGAVARAQPDVTEHDQLI